MCLYISWWILLSRCIIMFFHYICPFLLNKIHTLVIHLEVELVFPFLLHPEALAQYLAEGLCSLSIFWMNQWVLKDPECFLLSSFSLPWLNALHVWCNLAPVTFSPVNKDSFLINRSEIPMTLMLTEPHQKKVFGERAQKVFPKAPLKIHINLIILEQIFRKQYFW